MSVIRSTGRLEAHCNVSAVRPVFKNIFFATFYFCRLTFDPVAKEKSIRRQIRQYDKVIRENLEATLPGLMDKLMGIRVVEAEELPDDIQHTKERQPDVLKKVTDEAGNTFVLHIEFQVKDEPEMVYRMAEYCVMLSRKYKIAVRQYVIYLGIGKPSMAAELRLEQMVFGYHMIAFSAIDYRLLLAASDPREITERSEGYERGGACRSSSDEVLLAILADFKGASSRQVADNIAKQVIESSEGDFAEKRHVKQLRILMKLRNLDFENLYEMDSLAPYLIPERDFLYKIGERKGLEEGLKAGLAKGLEKGEAKRSALMVKNLLRKTDFTVAQIAELAGVSQYFVRKVKRSLASR